jgi:hypothetical protein
VNRALHVIAAAFVGIAFSAWPLILSLGLVLGFAACGRTDLAEPEVVCCEPAPALPQELPKVTRLEPRRARTADGFDTALAGQFWDTERQEECRLREALAATGEIELRCLPDHDWLKEGWYADATCSHAVHVQNACAVEVDYVRTSAASKPYDTCEPRALDELYPLGDPIAVDATIYTNTDGACAPQPGAHGEAHSVRPLGQAVPVDAFEGAVYEVGP